MSPAQRNVVLLSRPLPLAAATALPPFNEAHPPLMESRDRHPGDQTAVEMIGDPFRIESAGFDRVTDPDYNWQDMKPLSPSEFAAVEALKAKKAAEVDRYIVRHGRYWRLYLDETYATDEKVTMRWTVGIKKTTTTSTSESFESLIKFGLNLDLTLPDIPPPAAAGAAPRLASAGGIGGNFEASFTHSLKMDTTRESTFSYEVEKSKEVTYKENYRYLTWQIDHALWITRMSKGKQDPPFSTDGRPSSYFRDMLAHSQTIFTQPFKMFD